LAGWSLFCPRCGWESGGEEYYPRCPRCGSPLEIRGHLPRLPRTLGEGGTPLVRRGQIWYKLEYLNPTGSFKDRGTALSIALASRLGYKCVVEDTSGNTGISVAAYAAASGIRATIHSPTTIARGKAAIIKRLGAKLVLHKTREEAAAAAQRDSSRCFYVAHAYSPIFLEGISSIAGELKDVATRTKVLVPVSSGTLLLGLARGLRRLGVNSHIIAVQAVEAASLESSIPVLARGSGKTSKLADALVLRNPPRLGEMARTARGVVITSDPDIREAWVRLNRSGFIVEPSSATVEAARSMLGLSRAVLILTGSGLKYAVDSETQITLSSRA